MIRLVKLLLIITVILCFSNAEACTWKWIGSGTTTATSGECYSICNSSNYRNCDADPWPPNGYWCYFQRYACVEDDGTPANIRPLELNGDSYADIVLGPSTDGNWFVLRSTGTSLINDGAWITGAYGNWEQYPSRIRSMDVSGDGYEDVVIGPDGNGKWYVLRSSGTSFINDGAWISGAYGNWDQAASRIRSMDVNGDGRDDVVIGPDGNGNWYVLRSSGTSLINDGPWISGAYGNWDQYPSRIRSMDANGDDLEDIIIGPDANGNWYVLRSSGVNFINDGAWITGAYGKWDH